MEQLLQEIINQIKDKETCLIAIDGRCASGKTTLAFQLQEHLNCDVIHIDDFFMPIQKRSENFMNIIGGNIEQDRFIKEIIYPLQKHEKITYKKFDCQRQSYVDQIEILNSKVIIVEGTYSFLLVQGMIDISIFLTIDSTLQKERIIKRNGEERWKSFEDTWIPLEERYFETLNLSKDCIVKNI